MKGMALLVVCCVAAGLAAAPAARAMGTLSISPQNLALRLSDVPIGFTQYSSRSRTDAQADKGDHLPAGTTEKHGRISGYEVEFRKNAIIGLIDVDNSVVLYRSVAGAKWQIDQAGKGALKTYKGAHFKAMSVGKIGDASLGYELIVKSKGLKLDLVIVMSRRGHVASYLAGGGIVGSLDAVQVVNLAKIVDERIRKGHLSVFFSPQ